MTDGRTERGERTRAKVLAAAIELISVDGVHAATQRRAAALAGVSLASTTYHFPAAEDLLVAAFDEIARVSGDRFEELATAVLAGELEVIDAAMAFAGRRPFGGHLPPDGIPQLVLAAVHRPRLRPVSAGYLARIERVLEPLTSSPEAAGTLARALTGLILHEMERAEDEPSDRLRDDVARLFAAFGVTERLAALTASGDAP